MTRARLAWIALRERPGTSLLALALLKLGVATLIVLMHLTQLAKDRLERDIKGVDLVVAAHTTPQQAVLANLLHLAPPTATLPYAKLYPLRTHPQVAWSVPQLVEDSFAGTRIVGTEQKYSFLYNAELDQGNFWGTPFDAVVGSGAARQRNLHLNDRFQTTHGPRNSGTLHPQEYVITGVLKPSGTVIDQLILTAMESLWEAHGNDVTAMQQPVSSLLIQLKPGADAAALVATIEADPALVAAQPARVAAELKATFAVWRTRACIAGWLLVALGILTLFGALYASLAGRRDDFTLMRVLGASPGRISVIVLLEAFLLGLIGTLSGWLAGHAVLIAGAFAAPIAGAAGLPAFALLPGETLVIGVAVLLGLLAALWPAWKVLQLDLESSLTRN